MPEPALGESSASLASGWHDAPVATSRSKLNADRACHTRERYWLTSRVSEVVRALASLKRFAAFEDIPILIEGERGTGKTALARWVHEQSPRVNGVFHSVSLAELDDSLAGSALFGHMAGAFTDARQTRQGHFLSARDGTLFLDEVAKATPAIQGKLLRVIESGEVLALGADRPIRSNARLVLASNVSLDDMAANGTFPA